jgi:hypothetical protein
VPASWPAHSVSGSLARVRFAVFVVVLAACVSDYGDGTPPESLPARDAGSDDASAPDGGATASGDAATDAVFENGTPCLGTADCERLVFVTSTKRSGGLGGVAGGDAQCQLLADASPKTAGHKFKAWLSVDGAPAPARLAQGTRPYRRVDEVPVVDNWAALTSGSLLAPINLDETGALVASEPVWTSTRGNGSVVSGSCNGWTTETSASGRAGSTGASNADWTDSGDQPCTSLLRVYCFED